MDRLADLRVHLCCVPCLRSEVEAGTGKKTKRLLLAAQQYQSKADEYDLVLADFIPANFREWARKGLARKAYVENTHTMAAEDWGVFVEIQQRRDKGETDVLPTGIAKLDEMLGGLRGITVLGADKGVGKTSLALQVVLNVLRANSNVAALIYSLDMGKTRIYERLLCCETGIS
jgi:replicative DNA helicase